MKICKIILKLCNNCISVLGNSKEDLEIIPKPVISRKLQFIVKTIQNKIINHLLLGMVTSFIAQLTTQQICQFIILNY